MKVKEWIGGIWNDENGGGRWSNEGGVGEVKEKVAHGGGDVGAVD